MKRTIVAGFALLITGALLAPAFAQEAQPAQAQASPAARAKKKAGKKKAAKKAAPKAGAPAVIQEPAPAAVPAPEAAPAQPAEAAQPAPAAVSEPAKPEPARRSACPGCFQPLLAGYNAIIEDLKPWLDDMETKAAVLDQMLSAIQKHINEKDDAIEKAKLGTDKKEVKASLKILGKERKTFLNEYDAVSKAKAGFYKRFAKEAEKKAAGYNQMVEVKLQATLSAASQ